MKKAILTSIILILTITLYGQEIKISVAPTVNAAPNYQGVDGGPGQKAKAGFSTTFEYSFRNDKKINLGFGLCYQFSQVEFTSNMNTGDFLGQTDKVNLLSFNLLSKYNLKKNFFLSFNPLINLDINYDTESILDNQSGLGLSLSFGKRIKLNDNILLNIEPRLWIHNIIPFNKETYTDRLTIAGLNFGLVFRQKKLQLPE